MAQLDGTTAAMLAGAGLAVMGMGIVAVKAFTYLSPWASDFFSHKNIRTAGIPPTLTAILHQVPEHFQQRIDAMEKRLDGTNAQISALTDAVYKSLNEIKMNVAVLRDRSDQVTKGPHR